MSTDEIFKTSAKRQAEITEHQRQDALNKKADQQDQARKARDHAVAINARLRSGLDYLSKQEFPAAKQNGYDIQHEFRFSRTPHVAVMQLYTALHLHMSKGGVVHMPGSSLPYRADYEFGLIGDETSEAITVSFRSNATNQSKQIGTF